MLSSNPEPHRSDSLPGRSRVDLTTTLYGELRRIASARMAGQFGPQTLQATALVHEAWLRLGGDDQPRWNDRNHMVAAVAETMRHILIDRARRRQRLRHGGGLKRIDMDAWNWERLDPARAEANDETLLVVSEALERFALSDPAAANLVKLHFFAGLTVHEAAEVVGDSKRTAERRLAYARAWLSREIRRSLAA